MYATVNIQFSEWLVSVMEEKGWSKSEMARRAHISPAAISDILSGRRDPGLLVCQGIAKALKVPPEEVLRHAGLIPEGETEKEDRSRLLYSRLFRAAHKKSPPFVCTILV